MIVDASVGAKWILKDEAYRDAALVLLGQHTKGQEVITVPDLFYYELANVLATKARFPQEEIRNSLRVIFSSSLLLYRPTVNEVEQAAILSRRYSVTVYDMLYAIVAKTLGTILVTSDERFVRRTKFPHVILLSQYSG